MTKLKLTYLTFLVFVLLAGCDESKFIPEVSFDSPFPKQQKNLSYILGDQFTFVSGSDTQTVKVSFDSKTKFNYLIYTKTGDTLSRCWVSKFRQLYYFSEQLNDTSFWIYAVSITDKEIKGLQSGWEQMLALQSEVDKGKFSELVKYRDTTNHITRLTYNKTKLKSFYKSLIVSFPTAIIINAVENSKEIAQADTITATTPKDVLEQSASIVKNFYPNPATDNFTIDFGEEGNFKIDIYDVSGKSMKSVQANSDKTSINLTGFKPGTYYVRTTEQETNETALLKMIVER